MAFAQLVCLLSIIQDDLCQFHEPHVCDYKTSGHYIGGRLANQIPAAPFGQREEGKHPTIDHG